MLLQPGSLSRKGVPLLLDAPGEHPALLHRVEAPSSTCHCWSCLSQCSQGHPVVSVSLEELARGWPWGQECAVTAGLCSPAAFFTASDPFLI